MAPSPCLTRHQGLCADTMKASAIIATIEAHQGRAFRAADGTVWAWEEATVKGHDGVTRDASDWIKAPTTIHGLAAWLGY